MQPGDGFGKANAKIAHGLFLLRGVLKENKPDDWPGVAAGVGGMVGLGRVVWFVRRPLLSIVETTLSSLMPRSWYYNCTCGGLSLAGRDDKGVH